MSIIVLGSVNVDLVIRVPSLPIAGETVLGGEFYRAAGGKGANQAVAAARAGTQPITFIAAVGDDAFGRESIDALAAERINDEYIKTVAAQSTGVALIMVDHHGENCISVASGANLSLSPDDVDEIPESVFTAARVLLVCLESPLETVAHILARAKRANLLTILNPAPAGNSEAVRGLLKHVDLLTPNEHEATILTRIEVRDRKSAEHAGRSLLEMGTNAAVITLGRRGVVCVTKDETWHVNALEVNAVDTTAAGDAFNGVLAEALADGSPLSYAAQRANIAAGLSTTRACAQPSLPSRDEIEAAFKRYRRSYHSS